MQILCVNKYLFPKGGSETHLLGLAELLESRGHLVHYFGMEHADNVTPHDRTVTVPWTDYGELDGWFDRLNGIRSMLFSKASYERLREHLSRSRPALAHLHNIYHQLSPSVLQALDEFEVPCVLTAHDYKLVCPSYSLHDGNAQCFACRGHRYWNVLLRGCSRHGIAGDLALVAEAYVHHFLRVYKRQLDLVIAPSRFVRDRLVEGSYAPAQVRVLPNAIPVRDYEPNAEPGDYMLYVGRLSYEKGLESLLAAMRQLPEVPLWLAGDGPLRPVLEREASRLAHVRFLGRQPRDGIKRLLRGCRALVLPSQVPENCPLSVLEAFATAKPVIATHVGGVPELFEGSPTGLTVPPLNVPALAAAIRQFWSDRDLCWHCGTQARSRVESNHDMADYVQHLERIYNSLANEMPSLSPNENGVDTRADTELHGKPVLCV